MEERFRLEPADDAGRFAPMIGGPPSITAASGVAAATIAGGYTWKDQARRRVL
jgi:hypothetical protein